MKQESLHGNCKQAEQLCAGGNDIQNIVFPDPSVQQSYKLCSQSFRSWATSTFIRILGVEEM